MSLFNKKQDTDYAYAVARVRSNELSLLTEADTEQLIEAASYDEAMQKLADSGWGEVSKDTDYAVYLEDHFASHWAFLEEILDDVHELDLLLIQNDMQNLKAALKNLLLPDPADGVYSKATVYDTDAIVEAVKVKEWGDLPEFMQAPAQEAYDVLTTTANGQLADAIIDRATLERILYLGKKSGSSVLANIAERKVATANIKTALRCANTGKTRDFIDSSLAECETLNKVTLTDAALNGADTVLNYLEMTDYKEGAEQFRESTSKFEKWCDDLLMECVSEAKYTPFGVEPIVAYYVASDAEVKTARIILSAKKNNLSKDLIRERVRTLYV